MKWRSRLFALAAALSSFPWAGPCLGADAAYRVTVPGLSVQFSSDGAVVGLGLGPAAKELGVSAHTDLEGCHVVGKVQARQLPDGGVEFTRTLADAKQGEVTVKDRFTPAGTSVRWDVEVLNTSSDWSAPVTTTLTWPDPAKAKMWTAWQDPTDVHADAKMSCPGIAWADPLLPRPMPDMTWHYGGTVRPGFWRGDVFTVPIVTLLEPEDDLGLSLVQSPEDPLIEMELTTTAQGQVSLTRSGQRFGQNHAVHWSMDLVPHAGDWRPGLAWMVARYPAYFNPPNPHVQAMAGAGAYSGNEAPVDVARLKKMAFRTLWKLSDDYAYMGMFLPPVTGVDTHWDRQVDKMSGSKYKPGWTSFRRLNDFAHYLRENGFFLLSYFNVTEFGRDMKDVEVTPAQARDPDLWKDPSAYLKSRMPNAARKPLGKAWQHGWAVDPGDPQYMDYILEQARRHIDMVPDGAGICIDRGDYLKDSNMDADDGITWVAGKPARALVESWRRLMDKLGPLMHSKDKVIFANFMDPRLDLARHLDGIYDEMGDDPTVLNGAALVCLHKPLLTWTRKVDPLGDPFFQRLLYLGAFPTAPYPLNNHCIQPSPATDHWFLDYGPLFDLLRGKDWVLTPHCIDVSGGTAKANLFQVTDGWVAPVMLGDGDATVTLTLRNVPGLTKKAACTIWHPGASAPVSAPITETAAGLTIPVPLQRGCAMVKLSPGN